MLAKYVIHTVGPIYRGGEGNEAETLASCHRGSIRLADEYQLTSLSFPAISTGAYGYPVADAAPIAISAAIEALTLAPRVALIRFVLFDLSTVRAYERAAQKLPSSSSTARFKIEKISPEQISH